MTIEIVDDVIGGSVADLAVFTGLTERRVQQLEKSRVMLRIAHGQYDIGRSVLAYCNFLRGLEGAGGDKKNETEERTRLTGVKADLAELERAERQGALVNADAVRKQDFMLARILRNNLLSIPDRISALIAPETDAAACHRIVFDEVTASLNQVIESMKAVDIDESELDINRRVAAEQLAGVDVSQETPDADAG